MVRDMTDLIEGEGHGLQGGQAAQRLHGHLCQRIIIQPQVAQRHQAFEALWGHAVDVVGIQAAGRQRKPFKKMLFQANECSQTQDLR